MKRIFTLLLCLIGLVAYAQEPFWIDYCDGKKSTSGVADKTQEEVSLAIRIPAESAKGFARNAIKYVMVGWPTGHPGGDVTAWVRSSQNGENLAEGVMASAAGWQQIELANPYNIDGESDIWVGVTFVPGSKRSSYISLAGNTVVDGCHYKIGSNGWANYSSLNKGSLAIRAGVVGDYLPTHDIALSSFTCERTEYTQADPMPVKVTIKNNASDEVVKPCVTFTCNGNVIAKKQFAGSIPFNKTLTETFNLSLSGVALGTQTIEAEVSFSDGEADILPADNTASLSINVVEPIFDLQLVRANIYSTTYKIGDPVGVVGTLKSFDGPLCINPVIRYNYNNGAATGEVAIPVEVARGKSMAFAVQIPSYDLTEEGNYSLELTVAPAGEGTDYDMSNNSTTVANLHFAEHPFIKRMLCEEVTGTWCGYCPQGIYSMGEYNKQYPERFVGIAVHSGDEFANAGYYAYFTSCGLQGVPSCIMNRDNVIRTPSMSVLGAQFTNIKNAKAQAELEVWAEYNPETGMIDINTDAYFAAASSGRDVRVIFVVTEDDVVVSHANYFSGGSMGAMGGFESLPNPCITTINDIAHWVFPNYMGTRNYAVPATIEAQKHYNVSASVKLSSLGNVVNPNNLHVNALLIDSGNRGTLINCAKNRIYGLSAEAPTGINGVVAPGKKGNHAAYNLSGRAAGIYDKGIIITDGKKVIR